MRFQLTEITGAIHDRRTVFPENYSSRKVHREQLEAMLEAANWAPNHGQTEPWRFKVYTGEALKELMSFTAGLYKSTTAPEKFAEPKYDRYFTRAEKASFVVAICMKRQASGKIPEVEEVMATACAVQNMMLVATAYGIGTFWSTGNLAYSAEMKDYLHLEPEDKCLGFLYVGYPEGEWPKGKRNIWLNKVEWNE